MKRQKKILLAAALAAVISGGVVTGVQAAGSASVTPVGGEIQSAADGEQSITAEAGKTVISGEWKGTVYGGGNATATTANSDDPETGKYEAHITTAGADINITESSAQDPASGNIFGGGLAYASNWADASSAMTDTVNINISGEDTEINGVFGNGLAFGTGSSSGGTIYLTGKASVSAENTNINVQSGTVNGIVGGGVAIDDTNAVYVNAIAETTGTASINVTGGTVNKLAVSGSLISYKTGIEAAAGNAAIVAGGLAVLGGAASNVENAVVNVDGGTVDGDIYGGGIAVYGYRNDGTQNSEDINKPVGGSRVETSTINLTGGKVTGNVYAGGAVSTTDLKENGNYTYANATVGTSTINLAGTEVTGILYGTGTVDGDAVKRAETTPAEGSDDYWNTERVAVGTSTLNVIGTNTLSNVTSGEGEDATVSSKIQKFDEVNFAADSETIVKGLTAGDSGTALIDGGKVTVANSAKLNIGSLASGIEGESTTGNSYKIAVNTETGSSFWSDDNLIYDRTGGYYVTGTTGENEGSYTLTYEKIAGNAELTETAANGMAAALGARSLLGMFREGMNNGWENYGGAGEYMQNWSTAEDASVGQRGMLIGEDAAVTGTTVSIARAMADNVTQRLSFTDDYVQEQGSAMQDGGVWAKYMHRKYETDGMSSSAGDIHSSTDYDGILVGMDFAKKGNFQSGVAFHYGSGDGDGAISHNDYDAWGITLYGSLKDEEAGTNLMADIGWMTSDNDIDGTVNGGRLSTSRDVDTWTVGIRGEKEFVSGRNQLVPYAGLRYMSVNPGSYTTYYNGEAAFRNDADNQDLWFLPVGVSFRNETVTAGGWRITPKLDVSYIWAFGDTDTDMTVNMAGGSASGALWYDVTDDSSWLASLGVEAEKDAWTFGVSYGYQKGDDSKNKTWTVSAGFSF